MRGRVRCEVCSVFITLEQTMNLDGKVAIITGAGGGVGKALVRRFASAGAHVIAADVNAESITQIYEESQADGHDVIAMRTDVASESDVIHMVKTTAEKYGREIGRASCRERVCQYV